MERVELACHTEHSTVQGFYSFNEWFKSARDLGMNTLAVTDVCTSTDTFKDFCEEVSKMSPGMKFIPGIEMTVAYGIFCGTVSILIKNELGRKNLSDLLFEKQEEPEQVLPFERLIDKSRGLILGSGRENGLLQSAVDAFEFIDIGVFFDYIEIPANATLELAEELISIAEWNNRPAVAVGAPYYPSKRAATVYNGHRFDIRPLSYNRLLSTEEMKECFSYLEKDLIEEIVITNSNLIADMCE